MSDLLLAGKVALITGASSGIGRAAAVVFAGYGASCVLADRDVEGGEHTLELVEAAGGKAIFVPTDIGLAGDAEAMVDAAVRQFGRLDCAFNNAAIEGTLTSLTEDSEENLDETIRVDLKGPWFCLKYEIKQMLTQGGGAIVNTSSAAGIVGFPGCAPYVAAKHGVIGLTKAAALEYAEHGIRVNAVCPGGVRTIMLDRVIEAGMFTEAQAAALQPINRVGRPEEVAEAAAWLCSDRSSFVTGHAMAVDGGLVARASAPIAEQGA